MRVHSAPVYFCWLTPRLTGAGARSAEGTNTGYENAEGMASVGVRVEPTVRIFLPIKIGNLESVFCIKSDAVADAVKKFFAKSRFFLRWPYVIFLIGYGFDQNLNRKGRKDWTFTQVSDVYMQVNIRR